MNEKKKKKNPVPTLESEDAERTYWDSVDSTDHIDWSKARRALLPNLKPTHKTISLRLPAMMLAELKALANKRDIPYQSLLKLFLAERLEEELRKKTGGSRAA